MLAGCAALASSPTRFAPPFADKAGWNSAFLLLLLLKIGLFFLTAAFCAQSGFPKCTEICSENGFHVFQSAFSLKEHSGAFKIFLFFWGVVGEKFPYFECGNWKTCKLMRGKNPENIEKPKGSVSSFLFWPALPLLLYVLSSRAHAERKLALQMGSLLPFVRLILQTVSGCD